MTDQTASQPPLTSDEQESFNLIIGVFAAHAMQEMPDGYRLALGRVMLDGTPESVIAVVEDDGEGDEVNVRPLAMIMSDTLFSRTEPME